MRQKDDSTALKNEYSLNIPGRLRVKIHALKNNKEFCRKVVEALSSKYGIVTVTANQYTSRILVIYNINLTSCDRVQKEIYSITSHMPAFNTKASVVKPHGSNDDTKSSCKVVRADFNQKRVLSEKEFFDSRNVLSKEYSDFNKKALLPGTDVRGDKVHAVWHTCPVKEIQQYLDTDITLGLTMNEVSKRLDVYGLNQLHKNRRKSFLSIFFKQFKGFIIKLLFASCGISLLLRQFVDASMIIVIIGVEALLGAWQEYKADKSLDGLKQLSSPTANVIRNGKRSEIAASHLVPGDIILLETGNIVPADARLIDSQSLEVIESSLTGEPFPILKHSFSLEDSNIPLGDRTNMVYMGTSVVGGKGMAIIIDTAMETEMGKIAFMLDSVNHEASPLQKELDRMAKVISFSCLGICAALTLCGIIRGSPLVEMLSTGVSLAVGAIPEGLTTVLAISMAFSAQRMTKKNAIVKNLPSIETLSCTRVICTDKTGTLTKNEMTVKEIFTLEKNITLTGDGYNSAGNFYINGEPVNVESFGDVKMLLTSAALCNNAEITEKKDMSYEVKGDPTEISLLIALRKSGIKMDEFNCYKKEHEIPFKSETKRMTAICSNEKGQYYTFMKGALDTVIGRCSKVMDGDSTIDITQEHISHINAVNEKMAEKTLRVLALAYKPLENNPDDIEAPELEENMIFLGLTGMMDPPRPEVKDAILKCHKAGIKVVMITGDHKKTAASIARSIGLLTPEGVVLSGDELSEMTDDDLAKTIDNVQIFARTCPEQKLKIVKAFKTKGYIVAMTGDGINDAPALKEAHIGIAMGKSGADTAKEASSIILLDDNFNTVVKAIEEGRTINRNIKKFTKYVLTGNFAEVLAIFFASVLGFPTLMLPVQILIFNLVTEGMPALSLGVDPPEKYVMDELPRDPSKSIFDRKLVTRILIRGIATGLATISLFGGTLMLTGNLAKARTIAFANLVTSQMFHVFECSSLGVKRNKYIMPSVAISTGIMLASIYLPAAAAVFGMTPLNLLDWGSILLFTIIFGRIADFFKDMLYITRMRQKPSLGV